MLSALVIALAAAAMLAQALSAGGLTVVEGLTIALSAILSGWVGFGFASAVAGYAAARRAPEASPEDLATTPVGRTAILFPVYNEDPGLVLAGVAAVAEEIERLGCGGAYDVFILSDTRDDAVARAEVVGFLRLRQSLGPSPGVYYRRRVENTDRKAGNIADWVESQGAAYDYMLVLDADSLMSGKTILALTAAMDRDPKLGLLQTAPTIVNAETPYARLQQFASRLYGPVFARGLGWWAGSAGNYWGHNAIIRVAAFAESAGLPHLTGPKPWGGHIMSHDFIEAALLRRRGWSVRIAAHLRGSYEETPPTLLDTAARDRRWCQGNLQHARLLATPGLHWASRLHLMLGVFAYLAPALWLALLVCGAVVWPRQHLAPGSATYWEMVGLLGLNLALLIAPKILALSLALGAPSERAGFGGAGNLIASFVAECLASTLITPVQMVMQSAAVAQVVLGRDSGWKTQRREGAALSRREAWRAHRAHVALGVLGALGAFFVDRSLLVWASPVFLSLTLSAFLSLHGSRARPDRGQARRLFRIPEDRSRPPVLERSLALRRAYAQGAAVRRQLDALFRHPIPAHELKAPCRPVRTRRNAEAQPVNA